jgi:hypothetical protein
VPTAATKENTMPVGKARAAAEMSGGDESKFTVPCFTSIDEEQIRDHIQRDHFFWLDITAPSHEDLARLGEIFAFHPSSTGPGGTRVAGRSTCVRSTCSSPDTGS